MGPVCMQVVKGVEGILPDGLHAAACAVERISADQVLFPLEWLCCGTFSPRRLREFAAGRHAAHMAIRRMGGVPDAIPVGEGGAPAWPEKFVGSISHSADVALAVVGHRSAFWSIGVDVEECHAVDDQLADLFITNEDQSGTDPTLLFSIKECGVKIIYQSYAKLLDFSDLVVRVNHQEFAFEIHPSCNSFYKFPSVQGQYFVADTMLGALSIAPKRILKCG